MSEMVLPGTYIEVRPEGLIVPSRVTVGTVGLIGTAQKGAVDTPTIVSGYLDGRDKFGDYDAWDPDPGADNADKLTLVRALEIATAHGATSVIAVRVASSSAATATYPLKAGAGIGVTLEARSEGAWGNALQVAVLPADSAAFITDEAHTGSASVTLDHTPVVKSARNRIRLTVEATGVTRSLAIIYDDVADPPTDGQVKLDRATGALTFPAAIDPADAVSASYAVDPASATIVSLHYRRSEERYVVVNGHHLVKLLEASAWVTGTPGAQADTKLDGVPDAANFNGGDSGADAGDTEYKDGLALLLDQATHIIVGAGRDEAFADELNAHCQFASSDAIRRDRIAVVGTAAIMKGSNEVRKVDELLGHDINSDRVVYVAPGIVWADSAAKQDVTLPGAYAAAAVAGLLSSYAPHISLTNKVFSVGGVERRYTPPELSFLVQARLLVIEDRSGFRAVKGITTSTNTAWAQITTRRIVDYAKFGVRSAADPYIGLLNNERVRTALRSTIVAFLNQMVDDEMLISFDLDVAATRAQQRQGIVQVTMILRPTFSIDFIKVTMFLE